MQTKMTYLLKNNNRAGWKSKLFYRSIILLFVIILFTYSSTLRAGLSGGLQAIGIPVWRIQNYIHTSESGFFAYFRSKRTLALENQALKEKNEQLFSSNLKTRILQDENELLKNDFSRTNKSTRVLASVLIHPSKSIYDSLIIDVGEGHEIKVGDYVASGDVYIGKISEVYSHSSKAVLFSSSGEHFEVLLNPSHVSIIAYGRGGGNFEGQVPRGIDIAHGDVITVPGISVDIFATIEDIVEKPTDSFRTILFKNPVNVETLKWVEVITQ